MTSRGDRESEAHARSRKDNESRARASGSDAPMTSFRCECGDEACTCAIILTPAEYEHVRCYATHFAIARNHENPESEQLIEEHGRFDVMAPIEHDAVRLARRSDPRQGREGPSQPVPIPILGRGGRRRVPVDGPRPT